MPHLFESDQPNAEIIPAVGIAGSENLEDRIGFAAEEAGLQWHRSPALSAAHEADGRMVEGP